MMKVIGLFAGIGGIEYGLHKNGFQTELFCEILDEAQIVLKNKFPGVQVLPDVSDIKKIPKVDVLTAGFPCQDLSMAGKKGGLTGINSSLVNEVFRIIQASKKNAPDYLLLENVPYLLSLNKGEAIRHIIKCVEDLGYDWAYRVVDARSFGVPQRRQRLIFLASKIVHPKYILFNENEDTDFTFDDRISPNSKENYGFYWTEGKIGIGWARNSLPPIKGGSGLGIPSPPAIWLRRTDFFGTPDIEDSERLQGFPSKWTQVIEESGYKSSKRWKLIGNAVNTKVSEWVGMRIKNFEVKEIHNSKISPFESGRWPFAAFNTKNKIYRVKCSYFPEKNAFVKITKFIENPLKPLSLKASLGFQKRVNESVLIKYPQEFINSLEKYTSLYVQ